MTTQQHNPAVNAAQEDQLQINRCIDEGKSFIVEAGAGAGKTYALKETLTHILTTKEQELLRKGQHVACVTYTERATKEIQERVGTNPTISISTIHAFCWSVIQGYQSFLRSYVFSSEKFEKYFESEPELRNEKQQVSYNDLGIRRVSETEIHLHHDDVVLVMASILANPKMQQLLRARYPIILIDEYQDTNKELATSILEHVVGKDGPIVGFFGDHWQKIYKDGCGNIESDSLIRIRKRSNFRSVKPIVEVLNRIRPELPQEVKDPDSTGEVRVYHTNGWTGQRRKGGHWAGDLPEDEARGSFERFKQVLQDDGWDLSAESCKILILTNKVLAQQQGYEGIVNTFRYPAAYLKKEDPIMKYVLEMVEPVCRAYSGKRYGEMLSILGRKKPHLTYASEKKDWIEFMDSLLKIREESSIDDALNFLKEGSNRIPLSTGVLKRLSRLSEYLSKGEGQEEDRAAKETQELLQVPYQEIIRLYEYIEGHTPFSTKHGVKGEEYENVLVVFGRGWNQYNFDKYLGIASKPPLETQEKEWASYERNRNLFYVTCSRPRTRLALLFTQQLSDSSLETLTNWFGNDNINELLS